MGIVKVFDDIRQSDSELKKTTCEKRKLNNYDNLKSRTLSISTNPI